MDVKNDEGEDSSEASKMQPGPLYPNLPESQDPSAREEMPAPGERTPMMPQDNSTKGGPNL